MPSTIINSANIGTLSFSAVIDIYNRLITFDIANSTFTDASQVVGVCFKVVDSDGVELASYDWSSPHISDVDAETEYELDLSSYNYAFLFQTYKIIAAVKDMDGNVFETTPVFKTIGEPNNFQNNYSPGIFQVIPNCNSNILTVKELTSLAYCGKTYSEVSKAGTLFYPTGTVSPVTFSSTPFSNNAIYTGQYRIECETDATYDFGDDITVVVKYVTNNCFEVTCSTRMAEVMCCVVDMQDRYQKNCDNATGKEAKRKLDEVTTLLLTGMIKEGSGQDASIEAAQVKKILNCDCDCSGMKGNEPSPVNPSVYNIIINGVGGTVVDSSISGTTKTFTVSSFVYQVVKGDPGDNALTILVDTSTAGTVKYKILIDYEQLTQNIITQITNSPTFISQLNNLISSTGFDVTGLDGKCVIDITTSNYVLTKVISGSFYVLSVTIDGVVHYAPDDLIISDYTGATTWLNSLSLGTFDVSYGNGSITVVSLDNSHVLSTMTFETERSDASKKFTSTFVATTSTLKEIVQAIIDYLCGLTTLQVALSSAIDLCRFDYNGVIITTTHNTSQQNFNQGVAASICNIAARIDTLTGITCAKMKALFVDVAGTMTADDRILGTIGGSCAGITPKQLALNVLLMIESDTDVKAAYCALDCNVPATCPDVKGISLGMQGDDIGIYGFVFNTPPTAVQTLTVKYKIFSAGIWSTATSTLQVYPNGNIVGTTPFLIVGPTKGVNYQVWAINNCGGVGAVDTIAVPVQRLITNDYIAGAVLYDVCGEAAVEMFHIEPFAPGVVLYADAGLTTPVDGLNYVVDTEGNIFNLNPTTGVIGVDTGLDCESGTAGQYIVGADTDGLCNLAIVTLYTSGEFAVGKTLFEDSSLGSPVTTYSYVVRASTNVIYALNSGTGAIGAAVGTSCSTYGQTYVLANTLVGICAAGTTFLYTSEPIGSGVTLYSDSEMTTPVTGYVYALDVASGKVYLVSSTTGIVAGEEGTTC